MDARWTHGAEYVSVSNPVSPPPRVDEAVSRARSASSRPITLVLRVVAEAARDGRLAGRAEIVDTGEIVPIRTADELLDLIRRLAVESDNDESGAGAGPA